MLLPCHDQALNGCCHNSVQRACCFVLAYQEDGVVELTRAAEEAIALVDQTYSVALPCHGFYPEQHFIVSWLGGPYYHAGPLPSSHCALDCSGHGRYLAKAA
jgi:hypothetical protein